MVQAFLAFAQQAHGMGLAKNAYQGRTQAVQFMLIDVVHRPIAQPLQG